MQRLVESPLSYNSLQDEHLSEYFSSPQRRRHLRRMGLITRDGRIVDELTFQRRALERVYGKRHRDAMANTKVHSASESEWKRKAEMRRKLEELAKCETVQRIKREKLHPLGIQTYNPRKPHPAPGQDSRVPGQPSLNRTKTSLSQSRLSRVLEAHKDRVTFSQEELRELKKLVETITGARMVTPTNTLHGGIVPRPPSTPRPKTPAAIKTENGHAVRQRPHTAPTKLHRKTSGEPAQEQSVVRVKLCYLGSSTGGDGKKRRRKTRKIDSPLAEVIVQQQARGYTPIPVYRGQLRPGDCFSFDSIRYPGMPYSLVIYTDGMIDCRVSVCCEYRHRVGTLLGGGRSAHFRVEAIEGGSPCYQCKRDKLEKQKLRRQKRLDKSIDSEREGKHPRSMPQLTTPQPAQLDSSLLHSSGRGVGMREEEGGGRSPSPVSSLYSASFQSDSPQTDSDEEREPTHRESAHSLSSEHSAPSEGDLGKSFQSSVNNDETPTDSAEKPTPLQDDGGIDGDENESVPPAALVTRGGVKIEYQFWPTQTSNSATQTDTQQDAPSTTPQHDSQSVKSDEATTVGLALASAATAEDLEARESGLQRNNEIGERIEKELGPSEHIIHAPNTESSETIVQSENQPTLSEALPDESNASHRALPLPTGNDSTPRDTVSEDAEHLNTEEAHITPSSTQPPTTTAVPEHSDSVDQQGQPPTATPEDSVDQQPQQEEGGTAKPDRDLESLSRSTLTQVSERKSSASTTTTDSSHLPTDPQPEVVADDHWETEIEPEGRYEPVPVRATHSTDAQRHECETEENLCEEEFTKAWT